jgi:hypothetical protein
MFDNSFTYIVLVNLACYYCSFAIHLLQMFADWYANGVLKQRTDVELDALTQIQPGSQPLSFPTQYAASMATQRKAHIKRAYRQYWRSPNYNFARIMIVIIQVG